MVTYSPAATLATWRSLAIAADGTSVRSAAVCKNSEKNKLQINNKLWHHIEVKA